MKKIIWDKDKDNKLQRERGISFSLVAKKIEQWDVLVDKGHHNQKKYAHQRIFVLSHQQYTRLVPYIEDEHHIKLITIYKARKYKYLLN